MSEAVFDNGVVQLYQGDARQVLRELPAEGVHCVVTSPPYWGLRSYGHWQMQLLWGTLEHFPPSRRYQGRHQFWLRWRAAERGGLACRFGCCWIGALGLEPTIDLYVQHIVEIFREVRRVMRKDGSLWLNMGDSYAGSGKGQMATGEHHQEPGTKQGTNAGTLVGGLPTDYAGLKPKDLCMMPARVALALQADGWWLRSDIVWSKPNPMPESVTDRPTRAHEYMFLLTKAERYYYDGESIKEPAIHEGRLVKASGPMARNAHHDDVNDRRIHEGFTVHDTLVSGRNKRSVWEIATEPYPEAHFATFPQKLVEPCILAGTSQRGVCPDCGAPWERVVEVDKSWRDGAHDNYEQPSLQKRTLRPSSGGMTKSETHTSGWRPTCDHGHDDTIPGIVLDIFAGSGTVAYVAQRLGRRSIGIDLSAEYLALAEKRMRGQTLPMELAP